MFLNELIGQGELVDRVHDLDKSVNFLKMLFFLSFVVAARLISPGVFVWLVRQEFSFGKKSEFVKENPENYIISITLLLVFSVSSVGVYITQLGAYSNISNPVLMNMAITIFFFAAFLVLVNVLQAILFKVYEVFNLHFVDVISFLVFAGLASFTSLMAKWFLPEQHFALVQTIVVILLFVVFILRLFRLLIQGPSLFKQNVVLIFFYLCAAEISPFLIIGKLLVNLV
ncbi:MAG: DUF4271 domain-containing protein [Bacteroidia bacterium]